jgi:hypothetical protein
MTWEVNINTTEQVVQTTVSSTNVVVTPPTNASFNVTTNSFDVGVTNTTTTFDLLFDAIQMRLEDLNTFWRGEWVSGNEYVRGDIVTYNYSVFFLKDFDVDITAVYTSTIAPMVISTGVEQDTDHWVRLVWHEAPFDHIDVTNNADIGGSLAVGSTASIGGNTTIDGTLDISSTTTIGGGLTIGGNGSIGGSVIINGQTTINSTATIEELILRKPMSQLTITNLLTAGSLEVIGGGLSANGSGLTVNTTATFNRPAVFNNTATFNGDINFPNGKLDVLDLNVKRQFSIGDFNYPQGKGLFGQVLTTNGVSTATWVNLGDLVFWSLNDDLITNGFKIRSGIGLAGVKPELTIGAGTATNTYLTFNQGETGITARSNGSIEIGNGPFLDGGGPGSSNFLGMYENSGNRTGYTFLRGRTNLNLRSPRTSIQGGEYVSLAATDPGGFISLVGVVNGGGPLNAVRFDDSGLETPRIRFGDGTIQTTAYTGGGGSTSTYVLPIATTSTLGGIKVGEYLLINETGVLSINTSSLGTIAYTLPTASAGIKGGVRIGTGVNIDVSERLNLNAATTSSIGGIIVGDYLLINNNVLSVNTASLAEEFIALSYTLPIATPSVLGGIKVGTGLSINTTSGVLSVIPDSEYVLPVATTSILGGIKVGRNLTIDGDGVLNALTTTTNISTDLTGPLATNGYPIVSAFTITDTKLLLSDVNGKLASKTVTTSDPISGMYAILSSENEVNVLGAKIYGDGYGPPDQVGVVQLINKNSFISSNTPGTSTNYINSLLMGREGIALSKTVNPFTGPGVGDRDTVLSVGTFDMFSDGLDIKSFSILDGFNDFVDDGLSGAENNNHVKLSHNVNSKELVGYLTYAWTSTEIADVLIDDGGIRLNADTINLQTRNSSTYIRISSDDISVKSDQHDVIANDYSLTTNGYRLDATTATFNAKNLNFATTGTMSFSSTGTLTITAADQINLNTPITQVGEDIYESNLYVQKIYNFNGTFAPFFPAGVQFNDSTVQRTAYEPDQGLLPSPM